MATQVHKVVFDLRNAQILASWRDLADVLATDAEVNLQSLTALLCRAYHDPDFDSPLLRSVLIAAGIIKHEPRIRSSFDWGTGIQAELARTNFNALLHLYGVTHKDIVEAWIEARTPFTPIIVSDNATNA